MKVRFLICSAAALALLSAGSVTTAQTDRNQHHGDDQPAGPVAAAVRKATERYRDIRVAIADGYAQFQGCVSGPNEGAMGVHYAKGDLFDDRIDLSEPEVLVYEPRNGRLHLVAAEYVTDAKVWHDSHGLNAQPDLMGHLFHFAPGPNRYGADAFYELHVWAWKANPRGTFADWNPDVSCSPWISPTR